MGLLRQTEAGGDPHSNYRFAYLLWSAHTELDGVDAGHLDAGEHVARYRELFFAELARRFETIGKLGGMV